MSNPFPHPDRKRKKVDVEALQSPLKRIPGMDLPSVRDLLDIGVREIDELRGRAPESLLEEIRALGKEPAVDRLAFLRMAVYFAESDSPDPHLLQAWKWAEPEIRA